MAREQSRSGYPLGRFRRSPGQTCSGADGYSQRTKELDTCVRRVRLPNSQVYTSVNLQCHPKCRISHNTEGESQGVEGQLGSRINFVIRFDIQKPHERERGSVQLRLLALKMLLHSMLP